MNNSIVAVLFTGGRSSRMGRDKATLLLEGIPLWKKQLRLLASLHPDSIIISCGDHIPDWIPSECNEISVNAVCDKESNRGPVGAIASLTPLLEKNSSSHVLFLAVDLPLMNIQALEATLLPTHADRATIPKDENGMHPLSAIYPMELIPLADEALSSPKGSLKDWINLFPEKVSVEYPEISREYNDAFMNLNTTEDWKRLQKR